ncbi:DNA/RNA nuclease SfsA [Lentisphaera profundi]|uniref:Sugar fermentation stimulation protein homolog n=1 Tax=Lentisphaera profundi TaxID=1658616 RepID=A0ABY7VY02_9BACT|nr:DNA/RNA nuclease SfsA [Lentisphaera profundi]WDE97584.1 DNA/RNA nuclease SfsA [Lentisphaera profundi]
MTFESDLIPGKLIKRWKRFLSEIELETGEIVRAHCPNSGRMTQCMETGAPVLIRFVDDPKRKLKYTWELVHTGSHWVCINTMRANQVIKEALINKALPEFAKYAKIQPEYKVGKSRIDFFLENDDEKCFIEVKSVSYIEGDQCCFPDAPTSRGLKHLHELMELKKEGHRAVMLFLTMSDQPKYFKPATHVDPAYAQALKDAALAGVEILVYTCHSSAESMTLASKIPYSL